MRKCKCVQSTVSSVSFPYPAERPQENFPRHDDLKFFLPVKISGMKVIVGEKGEVLNEEE